MPRFSFLLLLLGALLSPSLLAQPVPPIYTQPNFYFAAGFDGIPPQTRVCHDFFQVLAENNIPLPALDVPSCTYTLTSHIQDAIDALPNNSNQIQVLQFPPGTFKLTQQVDFDRNNLVLKGAGADQTTFLWMGTQNSCFLINGKTTGPTVDVIANDNGSSFQMPNQQIQYAWQKWVMFTADVPEACADENFPIHQFAKMYQDFGNGTITVNERFRQGYNFNTNGGTVVEIEPREHIGFECFKVSAEHNPIYRDGMINATFEFRLATNCWVRGVESFMADVNHLVAEESSNLLVDGCYFHEARATGTGGEGYGVSLQLGTGECWIFDNIFHSLRHAMLLQMGANGNYFGYNFSSVAKGGQKSDLTFHGGWPFRNLIEGNSVDHLIFDNWRCDNGPFNIVFRNQTREKNIQADYIGFPTADFICAIGNESEGCMRISGNNHDIWDNIQNAPPLAFCNAAFGFNGDPTPIGNSVIYNFAPPLNQFFGPPASHTGIPYFGPDASGQTLPAQARWEAGEGLTVALNCEECNSVAPLVVEFEILPCEENLEGQVVIPGAIDLLLCGGTPPYNFNWGGGVIPNGEDAFFFQPTNWSVEVTDASGQSVSLGGETGPCRSGEFKAGSPAETSLENTFQALAAPNPLQGSTTLHLTLPQAGPLETELYAADGRLVHVHTYPALKAGKHKVELSLPGLSAGLYFCRLKYRGQEKTLRLWAE